MESLPSFDQLLRRARRVAGLTQEQLAERAGLSARVISDIERGVIRAPRQDTLKLLSDALGLDADEAARWERLRRQLSKRDLRPASAPAPATPDVRSNLPVPLTPLVGRQRETAEVSALLQRTAMRLLTLTGPGGIGKTRLALAVAGAVAANDSTEVGFVDLASITDPGNVLPAIASALGVKESAARTVRDQLVSAMLVRHLLLVLDNVEQVADAAPAIADLLGACPQLTILTTSRVPLHVRGEHLYPVPPLSLPDAINPVTANRLLESEAVALFVQRAQAVKPHFRITDDNAPAIAEICVRLDGLPLAIELAAARISILSPRAILQRLDQRLQLLTDGPRDLPARQRTLRDTIQWSYDLLEPGEQALLRQLSVFAGGWALDAAEAIVDLPCQPGSDALSSLAGLAEKSLIRSIEGGDEPRFGMLETIREFAIEELGSGRESQMVRDRHADYFIDLAAEMSTHFDTDNHSAWTDLLEREHDNLRAAVAWLRECSDVTRGLKLVAAICPFWLARGYLSEGRAYAEAILDLPGAEARTAARAKALTRFSWLTFGQKDDVESLRLGEEALAIWNDLGEHTDKPETLIVVGIAAAHLGDIERACAIWHECVRLARLVGDQIHEARALNDLGVVAVDANRLDDATELLQESLAVAREAGLRSTKALALLNLGDVTLKRGDFELGHRQLSESLRIYREMRMTLGIANCLMAFASAAILRQQPTRATRLKSAAVTIYSSIDSSIDPLFHGENEREIATLRTTLGDDFQTIWDDGAALTLEDAIAEALRDSSENEPSASRKGDANAALATWALE